METINFLITGVGGQGTVLAGDIMAATGLAAGYDVKKSDIMGLAVRGGAVVGHVRWGERVYSPIVPDGRVDYLLGFEILEGLRWLNHLRPGGTLLLNQQEIRPVTVTAGFAKYPSKEEVDEVLAKVEGTVYRVPGLAIARELGNARVLNVVLLGALSVLLPVQPEVWESILRERIRPKYLDLNLKAFRQGRDWMLAQRR